MCIERVSFSDVALLRMGSAHRRFGREREVYLVMIRAIDMSFLHSLHGVLANVARMTLLANYKFFKTLK